jgi:hypothetical protein
LLSACQLSQARFIRLAHYVDYFLAGSPLGGNRLPVREIFPEAFAHDRAVFTESAETCAAADALLLHRALPELRGPYVQRTILH